MSIHLNEASPTSDMIAELERHASETGRVAALNPECLSIAETQRATSAIAARLESLQAENTRLKREAEDHAGLLNAAAQISVGNDKDTIKRLTAERDRLAAIVDRLPKNKSGDPIHFGGLVWYVYEGDDCNHTAESDTVTGIYTSEFDYKGTATIGIASGDSEFGNLECWSSEADLRRDNPWIKAAEAATDGGG